MKLGATREFPDGKIDASDEGGIKFAIGKTKEGLVAIEFGTPVTWLAMPKEQAIQMAQALLKQAGVN